ncbi:MAG: hypothetical protein ABF315_03975 [Lentimonas sp.]
MPNIGSRHPEKRGIKSVKNKPKTPSTTHKYTRHLLGASKVGVTEAYANAAMQQAINNVTQAMTRALMA